MARRGRSTPLAARCSISSTASSTLCTGITIDARSRGSRSSHSLATQSFSARAKLSPEQQARFQAAAFRSFEGKPGAVVTDAGMPGISDPGYSLVRRAIDAAGHPALIEGLERVKNSFNSYPLDRLALAGAVAADLTGPRVAVAAPALPTVRGVAALVRELTAGWAVQPEIIEEAGLKRGAFAAADVALAASGTVSLELAANACPMVIAKFRLAARIMPSLGELLSTTAKVPGAIHDGFEALSDNSSEETTTVTSSSARAIPSGSATSGIGTTVPSGTLSTRSEPHAVAALTNSTPTAA